MANYYFRNTGNALWSVLTNWSLTDGGASAGAKPSTTSDTALFTALSGSCTVDSGAPSIGGLNCTGYTGTLTINDPSNLSVSTGSVILSSQMSIAGTTKLALGGSTITITTNGCAIPRMDLYSVTVTLMDTLNISDSVTVYAASNTWIGNFGFTVDKYIAYTPGMTANLKVGNTYRARIFTDVINLGGAHGLFKSSIGGTRATLTVTGSSSISNVDFTDINAGGGVALWTFSGILTNCININTFVDKTIAPVNSTITASVIS